MEQVKREEEIFPGFAWMEDHKYPGGTGNNPQAVLWCLCVLSPPPPIPVFLPKSHREEMGSHRELIPVCPAEDLGWL